MLRSHSSSHSRRSTSALWQPHYTLTSAIACGLMEIEAARTAVTTWPHASDVLFDAGRTLSRCGLTEEARRVLRAAAEAAGTEYAAMVGDTSSG